MQEERIFTSTFRAEISIKSDHTKKKHAAWHSFRWHLTKYVYVLIIGQHLLFVFHARYAFHFECRAERNWCLL
jgi:hypothetical protein